MYHMSDAKQLDLSGTVLAGHATEITLREIPGPDSSFTQTCYIEY